jgi:hypothetical protein
MLSYSCFCVSMNEILSCGCVQSVLCVHIAMRRRREQYCLTKDMPLLFCVLFSFPRGSDLRGSDAQKNCVVKLHSNIWDSARTSAFFVVKFMNDVRTKKSGMLCSVVIFLGTIFNYAICYHMTPEFNVLSQVRHSTRQAWKIVFQSFSLSFNAFYNNFTIPICL